MMSHSLEASEVRRVMYIPYYGKKTTAAQKEKCLLDIHLPAKGKDWPTLVWFHGGGLVAGKRSAPEALLEKGIAVVAVGYRLSPQAKCPAYIEDAAAATAWVLDHIAEHGGDPGKVFIGGHSAGGYLAAMVGMDPTWLGKHGRKPTDLAGVVPVSGQMTTHFQIRDERKEPEAVPGIDRFAPIAHANQPFAPMLLITGEESVEWATRVAENRWFASVLREAGHLDVQLHELSGMNHSTCLTGGMVLIEGFIQRIVRDRSVRPRRFVAIPPAGKEVRPMPFGNPEDWRSTGGIRSGKEDLDASLTIFWTPEGLQLSVSVTDDLHHPPGESEAMSKFDSMQVSFQPMVHAGTVRRTELILAEVKGRPVLWCTHAHEKNKVGKAANPLPVAFKEVDSRMAKVERKGTALIYSLTIPAGWTGYEQLSAGAGLALAVQVNDSDGEAPKGFLHWGDGIIGPRDPKRYHVLALTE